MKGIVLAGGTGSRLFPATLACSKQLLNIYDKPMIYYPLSILMQLGITEILIITTPFDLVLFQNLLKTGEQFGVKFSYVVQEKARGLADAFILGEDFIGDDRVCLILGDNLFYGPNLEKTLNDAAKFKDGAVVFGYPVKNPESFGVVEFDENSIVVSIEEKPKKPKSNYAVPGLYFYDSSVVEIAKNVEFSDRGELEITSVNEAYLKKGKLLVKLLEDDVVWLDTGTHKNLLDASIFVKQLQEKGTFVGCLEEICYLKGLISKQQLLKDAQKLKNSSYGQHILKIAGGEKFVG